MLSLRILARLSVTPREAYLFHFCVGADSAAHVTGQILLQPYCIFVFGVALNLTDFDHNCLIFASLNAGCNYLPPTGMQLTRSKPAIFIASPILNSSEVAMGCLCG